MAKPQSSEAKRIRRHVMSRLHTFLAVVQPALRALCAAELEDSGFSVTGETDGGVEFSGSLREGWRANLVARTASRVYCRAVRFRAGAREELYRRVSAFPWELWLPGAAPLRVESRVRRSRLRHEGAAEETFFDGLRRHYEELGLPAPWKAGGPGEKGTCQRILLRLVENICEVSMDMSGPPLYNRGYRTGGGKAPIRESLAAALLLELGWRGQGILVDGMSGSGTFAIEAGLIAAGQPPGGLRDFQFQVWPSFGKAAWEHIKKKALAVRKSGEKPKILGVDASFSAVELARRNALRAGTAGLWETGDFFDWNAAQVLKLLGADENETPCLVLNPPYGKRLAGGGEDFFRRLGRHIRRNFPGWKTLVLFPCSAALEAFGGSPRRALRLRHGGLVITAGFF